MRKSRFTEEQILQIPAEGRQGGGIRELCRRQGISDTTYYRWATKYGGLQRSDARSLAAAFGR